MLQLQNQVISGSALTGWQNLSSSVEGLTSTTASQPTAAAKGDKSTSSSSTGTSLPTLVSSGSSKSNTGAIVGGAVGGVVGGVLLAALGFFLYRRHKKRSHSSPPVYSQVPGQPSELGGAAIGHYGEKGMNAYELNNANERVEADGGNVIYKKEAPPGGLPYQDPSTNPAPQGPQELRAVMSPTEAPSPSQVHEIGSSK